MIGIYAIQTLAIAFLTVFALVSVVYYLFRRAGPVRVGKEKRKIYACGEDEAPENLNVNIAGFFNNLGSILGVNKLREAHSGDLSRYLTWIFIGMLLLIIVMVLQW